jgi:hypothetical protein
MNSYVLYKEPISLDTLYIVQYLYSLGLDFRPNVIIERNYPPEIIQLPSIRYGNTIYSGLDQVIIFYEECSDLINLLQKSREFKEKNPNYTING